MADKIIYIKPDEEITSVIDRLVKTREKEIFLVIPKSAIIIQSLVNLRLLKREANNLGKIVTIVSDDPAAQRLAKKTEFLVADSLAEPEELKEEVEDEEVLKDQITDDEFKDFLTDKKKPYHLQMSDIIKSGGQPASKPTAKKLIVKKEDEPPIEERIEEFRKSTEIKNRPVAKTGAGFKKVINYDAIKSMPETPEAPEEPEEKERFEALREEIAPTIKKYAGFPNEAAIKKENPERENYQKPSIGSLVPSFSIKIFGIFVASALVIAGLVFYLILPRADVVLTSNKETATIDLLVSGSKSITQINSEGNQIPIKPINLEDSTSGNFTATGEKQLNEKANGVITVFNAYSSSPQTLVETTRFISTDGKIFRLINSVTIPGAKIEEGKIVPSSIEVKVEADEPGVAFNIGPSDFTIPGFKGTAKYAGFYGKSAQAMSGGSTDKIKIMSQDDLTQAKDNLWQNLQSKIKQELASQIPNGYKLLDDALVLQIDQIKPSVEVGQQADNFSLTVTGVAKALIFSEQDVSDLAKMSLPNNSANKKDFVDGLSLNYSEIKADIDKAQLSFRVHGSQEVIWKIDAENIKKMIAGKKQAEVQQIFSQLPEIKEAHFSLWPFWLTSIPTQIDKIHISIDSAK